jgi:uncharacterized protein YjbI with pentapeptide repeats
MKRLPAEGRLDLRFVNLRGLNLESARLEGADLVAPTYGTQIYPERACAGRSLSKR